MYRCKDCGKEFKEYTEYCDCGNNLFDYIEDVPTSSNNKQSLSLEQKSQIVSWFFFFTCVFMAIVVWLIPIKTQTVEEKPVELSNKIDPKTIPNINKIWDDTPIVVIKKEQPVVEQKEPTTIQEKLLAKLETPPVHSNAVQSKSVVTKPVTAAKSNAQVVSTPAAKTQVNQTKPAQSKNSQSTQVAKPIQKSTSQNIQKPVQQQVAKPVQSSNSEKIVQKPTQTNVEKPIEVAKPVYNPNSPEMLKYKGNLRSAMFSKFPVGSIQGSGTCSVHFSIDSSGKLINRGFEKYSDNKSLNDAVYYMMMSVPKFNPPPAGYNGETIRMNFSINNGSYEITIN